MKKMLIIEDDKIVGHIYRHRFQMEGFQVELASDGEAGLTAVKQFKPDMVILDLMLPKLSGVEVLRKLRADQTTKSLPVIVLSNAYLTGIVQDAWKAGANHCMIKATCTPKKLIDVVNRLSADARVPLPGPVPNTPATPAADAHPPSGAEDDGVFQAELRQTFLNSAQEQITQLRGLLQAFVKSEGDTDRLSRLFTLYRKVHSLTSNSAVAGLASVAKMASALEALLKELYEKPKNINSSVIRTVAHSIDFLAVLLEHGRAQDLEELPAPNILVVDDEALSRRAVIHSLERAHLKCVGVEDPSVALNLLAGSPFDLVVLDVDMPGLSGFDLCTRLRALPAHAKTPVVFVTGLTDFESRARSTLSGGNDFIAKPFLFMELAVKALTHVLRGQLAITRR
ncbi:MAG: response regulator [Verrucomicrobia bacterium]|nr:MAG: response regulator [Verrucomicrobiota bacterium]